MNCEAFELRLNNVLDAGQAPETDGELAEHVRQCAVCRELQQTYVAMLAALSALPRPMPAAAFADRVLAATKAQPATESGAARLAPQRSLAMQWAPWIMALAAGLLLAVWGFRASTPNGSPDGELAVATGQPVAKPAVATDRVPPPPSFREVALLVPGLTAEAPAPLTAPAAAEVGADSQRAEPTNPRDWTDDLASGLRPLAHSTSGALDLMLGALTRTEAPRGY